MSITRTLPGALSAAALALALVASCSSELRIRVVLGDCDGALFEWRSVLAVRAQLRRDSDKLTVQSECVPTDGQLESVADLGRLLGRTAVFNDLPEEGGWVVRVQGYFTETCLPKTSLLCGRQSVDLGGSDVVLGVDCAPRVSLEPPQTFRECVAEL